MITRNKKIITVLLIVSLSAPINALKITDVNKKDPAFDAINYSITKGYLPLYSKNAFKPNQEITRRELALTIDTLIKQINQRKISLTETEIQELNHLSKSFKTNHTDIELRIAALELDIQNQNKTHTQIQEEITRSEYKLNQKIKFLQKQNIVMSLLLILSLYFSINK